MTKKLFIITSVILAGGCAPSFDTNTETMASAVTENLGCTNMRSQVFDSMYTYLDQTKSSPDQEALEQALMNKIELLKASTVPTKAGKYEQLMSALKNLFKILNSQTQALRPQSEEQLQLLIEMEFEDTSTAENETLNQKLAPAILEVKTLAQDLDMGCAEPTPTPTPPVTDTTPAPAPGQSPKTINDAISGIHFAFSTAYQSCEPLKLPTMDSSTESVRGVLKVGSKPPYKRHYASISEIQRTHYYVRGMSYGPGCFSVKDKPLVYDYGGQPKVEKNQINFFIDSGSGGPALGIDCSAFVSSGLAAAGLRYSPNVDNKPIYVRQTSKKFLDPVKSGWKCFERIYVGPSETIRPGDIVAIDGHVVMVDRVGADPFGLNRIPNKAECENITSSGFDFAVIQSSPSKGDIGINRYEAKDYLKESATYKAGLQRYARYACYAKFTGQRYPVAGNTLGIIRHKDTPECKTSRIQLANQSCVNSCFE